MVWSRVLSHVGTHGLEGSAGVKRRERPSAADPARVGAFVLRLRDRLGLIATPTLVNAAPLRASPLSAADAMRIADR